VCGRSPLWARIVTGLIAAGAIVATFAGPKPYPDLSITTPHGAWAATLASSLFVVLALACSIPMRLPDPIQVPDDPRQARQDLNLASGRLWPSIAPATRGRPSAGKRVLQKVPLNSSAGNHEGNSARIASGCAIDSAPASDTYFIPKRALA
jgi:hypothetical protein